LAQLFSFINTFDFGDIMVVLVFLVSSKKTKKLLFHFKGLNLLNKKIKGVYWSWTPTTIPFCQKSNSQNSIRDPHSLVL
jgi:hypothetical protein